MDRANTIIFEAKIISGHAKIMHFRFVTFGFIGLSIDTICLSRNARQV